MSSHGLANSYRREGGTIMNSGFALLLVFGIGVVTGLRSMTAPAVVAWAAHLGWINRSFRCAHVPVVDFAYGC